jgi:uncharacterized protein
MLYIDTSVLVAYYCPEPLSKKADTAITTHSHPAISALVELELFSAVSRKIREGGIHREDGNKIIAKFLSHIESKYYTRLNIDRQHYRLARDWVGQFTTPFRSLDAIHLAVASLEGATIITSDERLARSAESRGVDVILLE